MEAAIVASCQVYDDNPGIIGPGSRVIHGDYSTDVGVRWDAANTTALIAFRGSQVRRRRFTTVCCIAKRNVSHDGVVLTVLGI